LGSQGGVVLSHDGLRLLAVNAGSNDVSVFTVSPAGLALASRTPSGGIQPISLTTSGEVVYVLNAGGAGNITGFRLDRTGGLTPIPGSTRSLSGGATNPAEVAFSPDGRQLVVTEKATNLLDVYPVNAHGLAGQPTSFTSAGGTPFGFAFGPRDLVLVSEAAAPGSASSYLLGRGGHLQLVSGAVLTHQGAPCWAVVTGDGRFGYTGNGSGSVSAFSIGPSGSIGLLDADGATAVISGGVNDIALSANSRYLYVLQTGNAPAIHAFHVRQDGHLEALGPVGGLPAGTRGLAAR
jgi:6-phosphogluconolactonase (cycloisomerase 2 family)